MSPLELRAARSLASIYALRMLGLFLILPVFSLYAQTLPDSTPVLIGIAIGMYGLTQAILQIPFGTLSDRIGRKPVIIGGMLIFALGSVVAAEASSLLGVILGRALQGSGAVAAVLMATTADLTREDHRLKAMAIIGMTIGMSFAVSMVLGPVLNAFVGVPGIFWTTALLALCGIGLTIFWVPTPDTSRTHRDTLPVPALLMSVIRDTQLLRLDFGILCLHMTLTATFVALPLVLRDQAMLPAGEHWMIYLPVMVLAIAAMIPFVILAENKRKMKQVFMGAVFMVAVCELSLIWLSHWVFSTFLVLVVFFAAFNILEASLPSLVAKQSPPDRKGTAMGVYSSAQFFGAFLGGFTGGWMYHVAGATGVFAFCAASCGVWFLVAVSMQSPRYLSSFMINVGVVEAARIPEMVVQLTQVTGVAEAILVPGDDVAYLKVDLHALDREALGKFAVNIA